VNSGIAINMIKGYPDLLRYLHINFKEMALFGHEGENSQLHLYRKLYLCQPLIVIMLVMEVIAIATTDITTQIP